MHYNSPEHFLQVHIEDISRIMADAQAASSLHYAALDAAGRATQARAATARLIAAWNQAHLTADTAQTIARTSEQAGIALDDLQRLIDVLEPRLLTFIEAQLAAQPSVGIELVRRLRHVNTRFRTNITAVQLDKTLARMEAKGRSDSLTP